MVHLRTENMLTSGLLLMSAIRHTRFIQLGLLVRVIGCSTVGKRRQRPYYYRVVLVLVGIPVHGMGVSMEAGMCRIEGYLKFDTTNTSL